MDSKKMKLAEGLNLTAVIEDLQTRLSSFEKENQELRRTHFKLHKRIEELVVEKQNLLEKSKQLLEKSEDLCCKLVEMKRKESDITKYKNFLNDELERLKS